MSLYLVEGSKTQKFNPLSNSYGGRTEILLSDIISLYVTKASIATIDEEFNLEWRCVDPLSIQGLDAQTKESMVNAKFFLEIVGLGYFPLNGSIPVVTYKSGIYTFVLRRQGSLREYGRKSISISYLPAKVPQIIMYSQLNNVINESPVVIEWDFIRENEFQEIESIEYSYVNRKNQSVRLTLNPTEEVFYETSHGRIYISHIIEDVFISITIRAKDGRSYSQSIEVNTNSRLGVILSITSSIDNAEIFQPVTVSWNIESFREVQHAEILMSYDESFITNATLDITNYTIGNVILSEYDLRSIVHESGSFTFTWNRPVFFKLKTRSYDLEEKESEICKILELPVEFTNVSQSIQEYIPGETASVDFEWYVSNNSFGSVQIRINGNFVQEESLISGVYTLDLTQFSEGGAIEVEFILFNLNGTAIVDRKRLTVLEYQEIRISNIEYKEYFLQGTDQVIRFEAEGTISTLEVFYNSELIETLSLENHNPNELNFYQCVLSEFQESGILEIRATNAYTTFSTSVNIFSIKFPEIVSFEIRSDFNNEIPLNKEVQVRIEVRNYFQQITIPQLSLVHIPENEIDLNYSGTTVIEWNYIFTNNVFVNASVIGFEDIIVEDSITINPVFPPVIEFFAVNKNQVNLGEEIVIAWRITGKVDSISINKIGFIDPLEKNVTMTYIPSEGGLYELTVTNSAGFVTRSFDIVINSQPWAVVFVEPTWQNPQEIRITWDVFPKNAEVSILVDDILEFGGTSTGDLIYSLKNREEIIQFVMQSGSFVERKIYKVQIPNDYQIDIEELNP